MEGKILAEELLDSAMMTMRTIEQTLTGITWKKTGTARPTGIRITMEYPMRMIRYQLESHSLRSKFCG